MSRKDRIMAHKEGKLLKARGLDFGYCHIPAEIEIIPEHILCSLGKRMCGRYNGWGAEGDFEGKAKLAKYYGVSGSTIERVRRRIRLLKLVVWIETKGKTTRYWLRCNPEVKAKQYLEHEEKKMANPAYTPIKSDGGGVSKLTGVPSSNMTANYNKINRSISAASPKPAEQQARRLKEQEEKKQIYLLGKIRAEIARQLPLKRAIGIAEIGQRAVLMIKLVELAEPKVKAGMKTEIAVREAIKGEKGLLGREVTK